MEAQWTLTQNSPDDVQKLQNALGLHWVTAELLVARGLTTPESAKSFLYPTLEDIHSPLLLAHMPVAVDRIAEAMRKQERIVIFGDYDVDGVTSASMLLGYFNLLQYPADYYVPSRSEEGYGLNCEAVKGIAAKGCGLLITVDCGISDVAEIELARSLGVDVIVVDHHECSDDLPPAIAILNPKVSGSSYPFRDLAAVGVTFKLVDALTAKVSVQMRGADDHIGFMREALGLAALGSVADVVPMRGENRVIVRYGMKALSETRLPGLKALFDVSVKDHTNLRPWQIAFNLAPRINAAGRLGDAGIAIKLLTTEDSSLARDIAHDLDTQNRERQKIEMGIYLNAVEKIHERFGDKRPKLIVLADETWHTGVIGIVASRLVEQYHCPVVLIALNGEIGRGSARSIPGYHVYDAFTACGAMLESYGGHAAAAGLVIKKEHIQEFSDALNSYTEDAFAQRDLRPVLRLDARVRLDDITFRLIEELELMAPFGIGNPAPLLLLDDVKTAGEPRLMGASGKHLSFRVMQGDTTMRAIAFNAGDRYEDIKRHLTPVQLAFRPKVSDYSGRIELDVKAIKLI